MQIDSMDFNNLKKHVLRLLNDVELTLRDDSAFVERVNTARSRLERENMNVLVIGEFSRGKSTFINAILSEPVLPSKVNPTTATINIIKNGPTRSMKIHSKSGDVQEISLPSEKVNKFLDQYVTTVNENANEINKIEIVWPKFNLNCTIVDTPGVNDLDDVREEITYKYLSQADACLMILDSQQPLSESERSFLKDKVLGNDVNRILFAINRIDEVVDEPNSETKTRLINYVKGLLHTNMPLENKPQVYAVSAKEALRARYKKEQSEWGEQFDDFERRLFEFISVNASKGRLPDHVWRLANIVKDGAATLQERGKLLSLTDNDVMTQMNELIDEEARINTQINNLSALVNSRKGQLSRRIEDLVRNRFETLREGLVALAAQASCDGDLSQIKTMAIRDIRSIVESISDEVRDFKQKISLELENHFGELFSKENIGYLPAVSSANYQLVENREIKTISFATQSANNENESNLGTSMLVGGALGYIGASLLGPIGLVAAFIGGKYVGKFINEKERAKAWEEIRQKTIANIKRELDQVLAASEENARAIADKEVENEVKRISERALSRRDSLTATIEKQKERLLSEASDLQAQINDLLQRQEHLKGLMNEITELEGLIL